MNVINDPYDTIWEYAGPDNVIVLPITTYTKKRTNELSVVDDDAREAFKKYPFLAKRWGYLVSIGVLYPLYRSSDIMLLGIPTREHYASKDDDALIDSGLLYLSDLAISMNDKLFYLKPMDENLELTSRYLTDIKNIVVLNYGKDKK